MNRRGRAIRAGWAVLALGVVLVAAPEGTAQQKNLRPVQKSQKQTPAAPRPAQKQPKQQPTTNLAVTSYSALPLGASGTRRVVDGQPFPVFSGMGPPSVAGPEGYFMRYYGTPLGGGGYPYSPLAYGGFYGYPSGGYPYGGGYSYGGGYPYGPGGYVPTYPPSLFSGLGLSGPSGWFGY